MFVMAFDNTDVKILHMILNNGKLFHIPRHRIHISSVFKASNSHQGAISFAGEIDSLRTIRTRWKHMTYFKHSA